MKIQCLRYPPRNCVLRSFDGCSGIRDLGQSMVCPGYIDPTPSSTGDNMFDLQILLFISIYIVKNSTLRLILLGEEE